jgi:Mlc titration factor MtfA (ptsG expression regulator)
LIGVKLIPICSITYTWVLITIISYLVAKPYLREKKRDKFRYLPFKKEWRKIIQQRMPYFRQMPTDLQLQLKQHIQVFISEKTFIGCNGIKITDEIKVTIAAQACLLLLNRKTDYYPKLKSILVYPRAFLKEQNQLSADGVQYTQKVTLSGESWGFGKIVLSWQDSLHGAELPNDGSNVVIHEFAHQLDQENGKANGSPILGKGQSYECWSKVFLQQFEILKKQAASGTPSIFDYYGATEPAEFFAVVSEVFFEKSKQFSIEHPALYRQLTNYYKVDPIHW